MRALLVALQDWQASGSQAVAGWPAWVRHGALALFAGGFALLLARSALTRRRYRAAAVLGPEDLRVLHAELAAAERRTVGEILPVVLERSDRHDGAAWLAALVVLLAGTLALAPWLPWGRPELLLAAQAALGALGFACARLLPDFLRVFLPDVRAREMAEEQAVQEFHRHDLARTEGRTGVLLFVSLLERCAIVLADEGIAARVAPEQWAATNDAVLEGIRGGSLRAGLVAGIRGAGELLAEHCPVTAGDRNEVPDRIVVRRE